jgi:signal transduction histidine kinase
MPLFVHEMLTLVRSAIPRTIEFDLATGEGSCDVEADAVQLRQVVMNLLTNAGEAIGTGRVV